VKEVPVERVVYKEVEVPVEVVRTVVKRVPVATPALVAETRLAPTVPAPAATPVAEHVTTHPATGSGIGASPTHEALSGAYTVAYASYRPSRVSPGDLRLIASRLRSDLSTVDEDLGAPALAATLVSDMSAAGAAVDRSLRTAPATAPVEGTR
jgi:hypothetical protein